MARDSSSGTPVRLLPARPAARWSPSKGFDADGDGDLAIYEDPSAGDPDLFVFDLVGHTVHNGPAADDNLFAMSTRTGVHDDRRGAARLAAPCAGGDPRPARSEVLSGIDWCRFGSTSSTAGIESGNDVGGPQPSPWCCWKHG